MGAGTSCCCALAEKGAATTLALVPLQRALASTSSSSTAAPKDIDTWEFSVVDFNEAQVEKMAIWLLLHQRGTCSESEVQVLTSFVQTTCEGYLPNPYHNRRHALDVLHTVWRLGELMPWSQVYQVQEQFALMVAALAHDIGHFGLTNAFLVDMRDELAMHYNDMSPLEHMHCNKLFRILAADKTNVFTFLSPTAYRGIRKIIIDAIMYTDPVHHGTIVKGLTTLYAENTQVINAQKPGQLGDGMSELLSSDDYKTLINRTLLHAADLSNPCKKWAITYTWAEAVVAEFFAQGDQEKSLGLPVGMLNDRAKVSLPNSQLGFIQFMVAPYVSAYTRVFKRWDLLAMLSDNVGEWARMYLKESGVDESSRVEKVRGMLLSASASEIADKSSPNKAAAIEDAPDITDEDIDYTMLPWSSSRAEDTEQSCIVVREVRRWRENARSGETEKRQHRELVLLYVLSDRDTVTSQKDIVMKFNTNQTHFVQPKAKLVSEANGPRVVSVAVAADNVRSQIDRKEFDNLLALLLEKQVA